jgi:hypothetical protein
MNEMLLGAIAAFSLIIGLFFLRFWKTTGDRFFLFFALSFLIEGVDRVALYFLFEFREASPIYYLIRLVAYGFIVVAIVEKNKKQQREG